MEAAQESPSVPGAEGAGYFRETHQPIYSAALVLPFLLFYEIGLWLIRSDEINGGDAILLNLGGPILRSLGLGYTSASMVVLAAVFVAAQIHRKGSWRINISYLIASLFESLLYAVVLFMLLGYLVQYLPRSRAESGSTAMPVCAEERTSRREIARTYETKAEVPVTAARSSQQYRPGLRDFVLYCGAGVYEELVFRVILLGLLMLVCTKLFHMEHAYAAVWAVIVGAVIFSAFHHIGGEPFSLGPFIQRIFAGLYFSAIYFNRSFGIAAASHALYDILVGLNQYV
ncbi:MAG TPA: CPBP family intramembrane glutamic endopeptidase [Planctomycetota bacterium]|nr:CPBP family intramembrane glutamic endopeptidase [Planctomycetota bacterium]